MNRNENIAMMPQFIFEALETERLPNLPDVAIEGRP